MEHGRHEYTGVYSTGNLLQPPGRHSAFNMDKGTGLIPLGNRERVSGRQIYVLSEEESESIDRIANRARSILSN